MFILEVQCVFILFNRMDEISQVLYKDAKQLNEKELGKHFFGLVFAAVSNKSKSWEKNHSCRAIVINSWRQSL